MKIIGKTNSGYDEAFVAIVSRRELEKYTNSYYGPNKLPEIKVDDEIDLGKGHDFASEAKQACKETSDFIKHNKRIIEAIMEGITILGATPNETEETAQQVS